MKKLVLVMTLVFLVTGCALVKKIDNTPTKKVEAFLNKYQTLDSSVIDDLDDVLEKTDYSEDQKKRYKDIVKANYQKMTYKIKEEMTDGDEATVTAEIEVIDYSIINSETSAYLKEHEEEFNSDGKFDETKYNDYKIDELKNAKEKVKYTIDFTLTKVDDEWMLDDLNDEKLDKINGVYEK